MRYSKPLYGILAVYIPLSVLILWAPLPAIIGRRFFQARFSLVSFNEALWCFAAFLSALAASCYAGIAKNSMRNHGAGDLRGSIIAGAAAYALLSLLRRNVPFTGRFLPFPDSVAAVLAALFAWLSAISLREIFGGLELFESFAAGRRGEQLREIMREYAPEMSQTDKRLKKLMLRYGVQFIPPCLLMTAGGFFRLSPGLTVFTLLSFSAGFLLLGFLGLRRRELACASEGLSLTARDHFLPLPIMALGMGLAAFLALAASSNSSFLPPGIILTFFARLLRFLFSLFRRADNKTAAFAFPEKNIMPQMENLERFFPETESIPWSGWEWIKKGVIALAALLFLIFMIYPLLKRSGFFPGPGRIRAALIRWFGDLKKSLVVFFAALGSRGSSLKMKKVNAEELRRVAAGLLSGRAGRRELKRSVNLFAHLILWGSETAGVPWKPSLAPGEYCGLLAAALQKRGQYSAGASGTGDLSKKIIRSGELFEKALYSGNALSSGEEHDFKSMIQSITGIQIG